MAYVDFSMNIGTAGYASSSEPRLTWTERQAVLLARQDRLRSLQTPGRIRRLAVRIFSLPQTNRLADPKLEALRAFAVTTAWGGSAEVDTTALTDLGLAPAKVAEARAIALQFRPQQTAAARYVGLLMAWLSGIAAYVVLRPDLGNSLMTAIVSACLSLPVFQLTAGRDPRSRRR